MTFLDTTIPYFGWLRAVCAWDMGEQVRNRRKRRRTRKTILFVIDLAGKQYTRFLSTAKTLRWSPGLPVGDLRVVTDLATTFSGLQCNGRYPSG